MNLKIKAFFMAFLILLTAVCIAGCGQEDTPYQINDAENYSVSVRYDANGGTFTTNTSVIVDSYNISQMTPGSNGQVDIALLEPNDTRRGNDAFTAVNNGYFLAGWYTNRTETVGTDGVVKTVYSGKWDFTSDVLTVDPAKTYTASEPVITLYAAWVPMFRIEICSLDSGELLDTITFDPTTDREILIPAWDTTTGAINMHDFPKRNGYTFNGAYYDAEGKQSVETPAVVHPGKVDYETGVANDVSMKLYVDWAEGEWYHIYNAEQFLDHASVNGSYVIHADLDFTDEIWPSSLMHGNFTGTIQGNGHTFKNIQFTQTNNSKVNAGLFGNLTETANISDLTFENVTFTIKAGTRVNGTSYGLLAGTIAADAKLSNIAIASGKILIDSGCYFGTDNYSIGLLCGMGTAEVDTSDITCEATGDAPESVKIAVTDNTVTLEFVVQ